MERDDLLVRLLAHEGLLLGHLGALRIADVDDPRLEADEAKWRDKLDEAARKKLEAARDHPEPRARYEALRKAYGDVLPPW